LKTVVSLGSTIVLIIEIVVVFHAPFDPRRQKNSPSLMSNEIPFSASTVSYFAKV